MYSMLHHLTRNRKALLKIIKITHVYKVKNKQDTPIILAK